jgi:diguanylate cyclase (GGDEF)-like protein/PAS domain S-box-containing protein
MLPFGLSVGVLAGIVYLQPERTVGEMLVVFAASTIALVGWARLVATLTNQLTRSEQRAQFTFDQRMAGIALIGDGARLLEFNDRFVELTGYSRSELLGEPLCKLLPEDSREAARVRMHAFLTTSGGPSELSSESRWMGKGGRIVWLSRHIRRLPIQAGSHARAMLMVIDITEQKIAEQAAQARDGVENFHFLNSPIALMEWGEGGSVKRWSKEAENIFGWTAAEVVGHTLRHKGMLNDDAADAHERLVSDLEQGLRESGESLQRFRSKDGHFIWCRWFTRALRNPDGTLRYLFSAAIDVTELRQANDLLINKEHQLRAIFDQASVGIALLDQQGRWLRVNQRISEITGYSQQELMQIDFQTITHPEDLSIDLELARQVADGERQSYVLEKRYIHRLGHVVWIRLHVGRIDASEASPMFYVSVIEDISEYRRVEDKAQLAAAQVRDSEARFRSIFEQAAVGIALVDAESRWQMVNDRFCSITGYKEAELLQSTCMEITDPEDRADELKLREKLLRGEIENYTFEKRYRRPDASTVWVSVFAKKLAVPEGEPARLTLVIEDISEKRQSAERLQSLHADLEQKVALRTEELKATTELWAERSRDLSVLAEMMSALSASHDLREARQIIAGFIPQIFPNFSGEVWIEEERRGRYPHVTSWNVSGDSLEILGVRDCWALRRSQSLLIEDPRDPRICPHCESAAGRRYPHLCVPLAALGETIGLLTLRWSEIGGVAPDRALTSSVAEQISLAIGNVRLREELRSKALRDALTGLYNRRHFDETIKLHIEEHTRSGRGFSLLMIDIDHFKRINDVHGHDAGDDVLREVAAALREICRDQDEVFRLGGEEFVILLSDPDGSGQALAAERALEHIRSMRIQLAGIALPTVTTSIGAAHFPTDARDSIQLLKCADAAMYRAKRTGRNRVCLAGGGSQAGDDRRLSVVESVRV